MRIARVVGKLTLARSEQGLKGGRYVIVVPLTLAGLKGDPQGVSEELIAYDDLGATDGQLVALSESAEAAGPFLPDLKPVDAYCAAILDTITME